MPRGRPVGDEHIRRQQYIEHFGLKFSQPSAACRALPRWKLDQLDRCVSDEFRRILLGVK